METLVQDVRYALRQFARRPGFTAIAVLSLALGIGGNSLIFGLLDGFVFTPFPYPDADRLVADRRNFPEGVGRNDLRRGAVDAGVRATSGEAGPSRTWRPSTWATGTSPAETSRNACSPPSCSTTSFR